MKKGDLRESEVIWVSGMCQVKRKIMKTIREKEKKR